MVVFHKPNHVCNPKLEFTNACRRTVALQLQCTSLELDMSASTFPVVRTTAENRAFVESALRPGETLSSFIEQSVLERARWRKEDEAFYAEAVRRSDNFKSGQSKAISADESIRRLRELVASNKHQKQKKAA
jgi:hypothetical protein